MATVTFTIQVDDVDDEDFNITDKEAEEILSDFEEILGKRNYSLYNSSWERYA